MSSTPVETRKLAALARKSLSWRNSRVSTAPGTELMPASKTVSESSRTGSVAAEEPSWVASQGAASAMIPVRTAAEAKAIVVTVGPIESRSPPWRTM